MRDKRKTISLITFQKLKSYARLFTIPLYPNDWTNELAKLNRPIEEIITEKEIPSPIEEELASIQTKDYAMSVTSGTTRSGS